MWDCIYYFYAVNCLPGHTAFLSEPFLSYSQLVSYFLYFIFDPATFWAETDLMVAFQMSGCLIV